MKAAAELAGLFAAHAVWCIRDGDTLIPIIGYETSDGQRGMNRLVSERLEDAAASGKEWLATNPDGVARAVLVFDGYVTLSSRKTDALIVVVRDYLQADAQITLGVPYRPAADEDGFALHPARFLAFKGAEPDWPKIEEAFSVGIARHQKGAQVWNTHLGRSIDLR